MYLNHTLLRKALAENYSLVGIIQYILHLHFVFKYVLHYIDSQGNPRIQPNSKGRKRRPGTKTLEHALKTTDENFLDFINKCLHWDPEQRLKPDEALKHPWMLKSSKKHTIPR